MISPEAVEAMIKTELPDAQVQVLSPDGEHFEVTVVSAQFRGKPKVRQHQMVYAAVNQAMATEAIHALALKTAAPDA
jgi:acid stress-induced BolA-like protein IbaG/YrbA